MAEIQKILIEEFPEIEVDTIKEIDIKIKTEILTYQTDSINRDVSKILQEEVQRKLKCKNIKKIRKNVIS